MASLKEDIEVPPLPKCYICEKEFDSLSSLERHFLTFHNTYDTVEESNNKQVSHTKHKILKCESCGKSFSHAHTLKKHIYTVHEGHKDYKCESCGKSFSEARNLKKHIHIIHEG